MPRFLDARIPVRFVAQGQAHEACAWLAQDGAGVPASVPVVRFSLPPSPVGHPAACSCCIPRGPVEEALGRLFLARVRGEVPFFRTVIAVASNDLGVAAIKAALRTDPVSQARFRLAD